MSKQTIRPYAMLIYGLQDDFISVLKSVSLEGKGQVINDTMSLKNDGSQELSFEIPMYYTNELTGERELNPLWAKTQGNELAVNLRKIKVIFYPDLSTVTSSNIFEFVITQKTDIHEAGELRCSIMCEGLAYRELGSIGYSLHLTQDDFLAEYEEWASQETPDPLEEPVMNLNYWADKLFRNNTMWTYEVSMDWSAYPNENRSASKIYEDAYVSDWDDATGVATAVVSSQEKYRAIDCSESNYYNITQDIAEAFGVYCKYVYTYDDNYKIIGKKVVFYNNYLAEANGILDINYPNNSNQIQRTIESQDTITKMYVTDIEDSDMASGYISISDTKANYSGENYIFNFDYLKSIGALSSEQLDAIDQFQIDIHSANTQLKKMSEEIADSEIQLTELKAKLQNATNGAAEALENMQEAQNNIAALVGDYSILSYTTTTPQQAVLVTDTSTTKKARVTGEGVLTTGSHTIKAYSTYSAGIVSGEITGLTYDSDTGYLRGFSNSLSGSVWLVYDYQPIIKYQQAYDQYALVYNQQLQEQDSKQYEIDSLTTALEDLQANYDVALTTKQTLIDAFERLMGGLIREGSWQDDTYKDYGSKKTATLTTSSTTGDPCFLWDDDLFDSEQKHYYTTGTELTTNYYPIIYLDTQDSTETQTRVAAIAADTQHGGFENLSFIYTALNSAGSSETTTYFINIGGGGVYCFIKNSTTARPAIMMLSDETDYQSYVQRYNNNLVTDSYLGYVITEINETTHAVSTSYYKLCKNIVPVAGSQSTPIIYPRLQIADLNLKTSDDKFTLSYNNNLLEKYTDYSILSKNNNYYISIKALKLLEQGDNWNSKSFVLKYEISNAAISLYLDALEVMKNNSIPQVSYDISVANLPDSVLIYLYNYLNHLVHINDTDLLLENVTGYISEVTLSLSKPWEDNITITDYKTKFEDLFTSITAATAQMKSNGAAYDMAASAFSVAGNGATLNEQTLQSTLNKFDFNLAFQNGDLTIDEQNGIWALQDTDDDGVADAAVAIRGGGIFCATEKVNGDWNWNTAITPSGINASLITAGQLDTNLIRIFAGNDVALQLNSKGLYAYQEDGNGGYNYDTYVVHNKNGLFFTDDDVNKVAISWNGLQLKNNAGTTVFYADTDGNVLIDYAHLNNATIDGLTIQEITTPVKGVNFKELNGTEYKYATGASSPDVTTLNWLVNFAYVTLDTTVSAPWTVQYTYNPNAASITWTTLDLTAASCPVVINNTLKTIAIDYTILQMDGTQHDNCYLKFDVLCTPTAGGTSATYTNYISLYKVTDGQKGDTGTAGTNNATVYLYQRATSAPSKPSTNLVYNFSTGVLSGTLGNWKQSVPAGTNPCYIIQAVAASTSATDTIAPADWQGPNILAQNGDKGDTGNNGINTATVYLYQRAASVPSAPTVDLTYTFSTGILEGTLGLWTQTVPTGTNPCYIIQAVAASTSATDIIDDEDWSAPTLWTQNGEKGDTGDDGINTATIYLYKRVATLPTVPSSSLIYTFSSGDLTGSLENWVRTVPSGTDPCYVTQAIAASAASTDTIAPGDWCAPTILAQDGDDGVSILSEIYYYQMAESTPTVPSSSVSDPTTEGWSLTEPSSATDSQSLYYIIQTNFSDGTRSYSSVQTSTTYGYNQELENLINRMGEFKTVGGSTVFQLGQEVLTAIQEQINLGTLATDTSGMEGFISALLTIGGDTISTAVYNSSNFSATEQSAQAFSAWIANNTSSGTEITSALRFDAEGLHLLGATNDKYNVLIKNTGMQIRRDTEVIARFRKEQLTVSNIRLASPSNDSASRVAIKEAPDGGIMWVADVAITED